MTAQTLFRDLVTQGVILSIDGDRLDVEGPDAILTDDLLATLRARKAELLDLLVDENVEMHVSALFDVVVDLDFYDGRRLRIPQQSTPPGWTPQF